MDDTDRLAFTVRESAQRANVGKDFIYDAIRDGRLLAKKAGRKTLIPRDGLLRFIDDLPDLTLRAKASRPSDKVKG